MIDIGKEEVVVVEIRVGSKGQWSALAFQARDKNPSEVRRHLNWLVKAAEIVLRDTYSIESSDL